MPVTHQSIQIQSSEGLPIRATLSLPAAPSALVLVIHGFKGFREWGFFPWVAEQLAGCGYAVFRFDMSRNGVGEDASTFERLDLFADDTYSIQLSDLQSVQEAIGDRSEVQDLPLFLLGHSRGGAIALLGSAEAERLKGVITWASISRLDRWSPEMIRDWKTRGYLDEVNQRTHQTMRVSTAILEDLETNRSRFNLERAVRRLSVPLLVVHGTGDETVSPSEAITIASQASDVSLMLIRGASHTFGAIHPLIHVPGKLRLALDATAAFISGHSIRREVRKKE